jgi:sortase A
VSRGARILSIALITAGLVVLLDVGLTLAWKEPASSIYGWLKQRDAANELKEIEAKNPTAADLAAIRGVHPDAARVKILAERYGKRIRKGHAIGRLKSERMNLNIVVVEGTDTADLQRGPGHYPDTALPGEGKTVGIAGHRTTYLAPFHNINTLKRGDDIIIKMPYATFDYQVTGHKIVSPGETQIVDNVGYERLVMTACHPLYSAAQRYAVFSKLKSITVPPKVKAVP